MLKTLQIFGIQNTLGTWEESLWVVNNASTPLQQIKLIVPVRGDIVDQPSVTVWLMLTEAT